MQEYIDLTDDCIGKINVVIDFVEREIVKKKLLAEFREWFCEGYCQFYGMDDYCRCCPVKDESCWLRDVEKPTEKKGKREPIRFCDTCRNFKSDERELNDDEMDRAIEESAKRHYSDLCALNHSLRFKMPNEYNDDNWGFYYKECKDYEEI